MFHHFEDFLFAGWRRWWRRWRINPFYLQWRVLLLVRWERYRHGELYSHRPATRGLRRPSYMLLIHQVNRVTEQGGRYLCVFASSENPEYSKKWIEHIFELDQAIQLSEIQPMMYPPATEEALERLRQSSAPAIQTYGDILFNVVYPSAEFAYNQIFNGGGIDPETCSMRKTGNLNPFVNILWNSNLFARAVQRVAYENWDPQRAAAEAHEALAKQVEVSRAGLSRTNP